MSANYILFYSNQCEFSNEILNVIKSNGIVGDFVMINIDTIARNKLPSFVDRVPLILIRNKSEVVIEDHLFPFLNSISKKTSTSSGAAGAAVASGSGGGYADDLAPAHAGGGGFSDSFSFIEDDQSIKNGKPFEFIDNTDTHRQGANLSSLKEPKFSADSYDKYMSQRDADMASIFPRSQRQ